MQYWKMRDRKMQDQKCRGGKFWSLIFWTHCRSNINKPDIQRSCINAEKYHFPCLSNMQATFAYIGATLVRYCSNITMKQLPWQYVVLICWEYQPNIGPRLIEYISIDVWSNVSVISGQYCTNISLISSKQSYWQHTRMFYMSAKCWPGLVTYIRLDIGPMPKCVSTYILVTYHAQYSANINPGIHAILAERLCY